MMDELVSLCKDKGISEIRGYYYPTAKNKMVKDYSSGMKMKLKIAVALSHHTPGQYKKKNEVIRLEES